MVDLTIFNAEQMLSANWKFSAAKNFWMSAAVILGSILLTVLGKYSFGLVLTFQNLVHIFPMHSEKSYFFGNNFQDEKFKKYFAVQRGVSQMLTNAFLIAIRAYYEKKNVYSLS